MRIPEHKVEEIYQAADIVEVIQDFVQLKKRGANWVGLSPFKSEKTPSFTVSPAKGIFKDFSSGKGGNAVAFLMELEGLSYPEALMYLAKKYHIEIEVKEDPAYRDEESRKQSLFNLNEFAAKYFHHQLLETTEGKSIGLSYFTERGITRESVEKFQLGYSLEEWDAFTKHAIQAKYAEEFLTHTGLTLVNEAGDRKFDRFRGRVIFPIHSVSGKIAGFGGRVLKADAKAAKYVNSPESDIYHKSEVLYGLFFAREAIRQADEVILVEGYLDVISLHQRGIRNVVAASGTALSEVQVKSLARLTKKIVMVNDADLAGISATNRAIDLLLEKEMNVSTLLLPEGEDPDSYIKANGPEGFKEYMEANRKDFLDFRIQTSPKSLLTPDGKASLVDSIAASLAKIPDMVRMQAWIQAAARRLDFPEQTIASAVNRALIEAGRLAAKAEARSQATEKESSEIQIGTDSAAFVYSPFNSAAQEKEILRLLVNHGNTPLQFMVSEEGRERLVDTPVLEYVFVELSDFTFTDPLYDKLRQIIFEKAASRAEFIPNDLLNHFDPAIGSLVAELLLHREQISENWKKFDMDVPDFDEDLRKALDSSLHYFITYHIERMRATVKSQIEELMAQGILDNRVDALMNKVKRLNETFARHNTKTETTITGFPKFIKWTKS
jgi:DNA primase